MPVGNKHTSVAADQAFAQSVMICLGGIGAATDAPQMRGARSPRDAHGSSPSGRIPVRRATRAKKYNGAVRKLLQRERL